MFPAPLISTILVAILATPPLSGALADDAPGFEVEFGPSVDVSHVNRGELAFLDEAPEGRPVHHLKNRLTLPESSLNDGWVHLEQCHDHLDAVPRAQVMYNDERVRDLFIELRENIGEAWVEGASVQLRDVERGARLCVTARSRALERDDGDYVIRHGPFMRQFLDGFYPMRVTLDIELPKGLLRLSGTSPEAQTGFTVSHDAVNVRVEALFEGRLHTEVRLETLP